MRKYAELSQIIETDDAVSFQKYLDQGFTIANGWEDKEAFGDALFIYDFPDFKKKIDLSKPLDTYEFKVADLFLNNGFDLRCHRNLLTCQVAAEITSWYDNDGYSSYGLHPDGRGSAFLIKHGAPILWLNYNPGIRCIGKGRTALDLALTKRGSGNHEHCLIIPYLKKAGCKQAVDLSHQERLIASPLLDVVNLDDLDDLRYFFSKIKVFDDFDLLDGGGVITAKMVSSLSRSIDDKASYSEWKKMLDHVIAGGLSLERYGNKGHWFWYLVNDITQTTIHPTHINNNTDIKAMELLLNDGVWLNQVQQSKSALDLAIEHQNSRLIGFLEHHGAKTFATLLEENRLIRDEYDEYWLLNPERAEK